MVRGLEHGRDTVYSIISLAALADTGWYSINWDYMHNISWGYKKGCDFVHKQCVDENEFKANFSEFCVNTDYSSGCSYNHLHKGVCSMTRYNAPIPLQFRYFKDAYIGGAD